eukprot:SAG31_NODE_406_length_16063_cov_22.636056_2_plen_141_part_00
MYINFTDASIGLRLGYDIVNSSSRDGFFLFRLLPAIVEATFVSPELVRCVTPARLPGNVTMRVTNNAQQFGPESRVFEYYSAPHIHSILPHVGPIRGGTRVTLFGVSFLPYPDLGCIFGSIKVQAQVCGAYHLATSNQHA